MLTKLKEAAEKAGHGTQLDKFALWDLCTPERIKALIACAERLRDARNVVASWCHTQGNSPTLFAEYLAPIDAALSALKEMEP